MLENIKYNFFLINIDFLNVSPTRLRTFRTCTVEKRYNRTNSVGKRSQKTYCYNDDIA